MLSIKYFLQENNRQLAPQKEGYRMDAEFQSRAGQKLIRVLAFTLVITVMSATMFNIVLPRIADDFGLTISQVSWVSSSFLLVYAIGTMLYGKLADSYKLKSLLTFGLVFFAFGSLIGLAAQNYWMVLLGRVLQGIGAAVVPATAGIIPARFFPPETRGRALGIAMTGLAIGSAIGPAVAALVVSAVHWRWLFCMPLFGLLALPFYRKYLNEEPAKEGSSIDWLGGGLLTGAVAALLLAITNAAWPYAAGCAVLLIVFYARIRSAKSPFIRLELLRNKSYSVGIATAFAATGVAYSLPFLSPQLLTHVNGLSPAWVGLTMVPAAAVTALLGRSAGKLADARGNPFLFYASTGLLGFCLLLLSAFAGIAPAWIAVFLIFGTVGHSFMYIALSNGISRTLPQDQVGIGMGLLSMLNFIAGAVSASLFGGVVDRGASSGWNPLNTHPSAFAYSNLYLVLAGLLAIFIAVYFLQFGGIKRDGVNATKATSIS